GQDGLYSVPECHRARVVSPIFYRQRARAIAAAGRAVRGGGPVALERGAPVLLTPGSSLSARQAPRNEAVVTLVGLARDGGLVPETPPRQRSGSPACRSALPPLSSRSTASAAVMKGSQVQGSQGLQNVSISGWL